MQDLAFPRVQFSIAPYIVSAFGDDSPLVSPVTWCIMFSYKKAQYVGIRYLGIFIYLPHNYIT